MVKGEIVKSKYDRYDLRGTIYDLRGKRCDLRFTR